MRTDETRVRRPAPAEPPGTGHCLVVVQGAYGKFGRGVEFFPKVEPDYGQVIVHARGNLSLDEKNQLVSEVEQRVLAFKGLKTVYSRIGEQPRGLSELTEGISPAIPWAARRSWTNLACSRFRCREGITIA